MIIINVYVRVEMLPGYIYAFSMPPVLVFIYFFKCRTITYSAVLYFDVPQGLVLLQIL